MRQVVAMHGGETFDTYEEYVSALSRMEYDPQRDLARRWKSRLAEELGPGFDVIAPEMPCKLNAKYREWKIWFDKMVPFLRDGAVLVGHSLGGLFLAKYLAETAVPFDPASVMLVSAPFDVEGKDYTLADFALPGDLSRLAALGGRVVLFHSEDDPVVPFADFEKYSAALPEAGRRVFHDRQHFNQERFPELADELRALGPG